MIAEVAGSLEWAAEECQRLQQSIATGTNAIARMKAEIPLRHREDWTDDDWIAARRATLDAETTELQLLEAALTQHVQNLISNYGSQPGSFCASARRWVSPIGSAIEAMVSAVRPRPHRAP